VSKQLGRSGTSIGANVWEADHAFTDADFANKVAIARKESSECEYWLTLAARVGLLTKPIADALLAEANELTRILSAVVLKTQQHLAKSAQSTKRPIVRPAR
jgi:four helix bundle protein